MFEEVEIEVDYSLLTDYYDVLFNVVSELKKHEDIAVKSILLISNVEVIEQKFSDDDFINDILDEVIIGMK